MFKLLTLLKGWKAVKEELKLSGLYKAPVTSVNSGGNRQKERDIYNDFLYSFLFVAYFYNFFFILSLVLTKHE